MQLHRQRLRFAEAGVGLTLIGQATPPHAAHFRRTQGVDLTVLADAERVSYRAAGAKIAMMDELLGPPVVARGIVAIASHGVFQGRQVGDFAQLGGVLVVDTDGTIAWSHMSEDASDIATPDVILEGLRTRLSLPLVDDHRRAHPEIGVTRNAAVRVISARGET